MASVPKLAPEKAQDALELVTRPCCLCGVESVEVLAVGEDFEYRTSRDTFLAMRCSSCGLVYLNPRPAPSELSRIYPETYHAYQFTPENFGLAHRARKQLEARRLLNYCRGLSEDARILDVGCGDGFHLRLLAEFGSKRWTLEGVDASERAVASAQKAGLAVRLGAVESIGLEPASYDLVLLIATIEHVDDPVGVLSAVRDALRPGGRVVIVTDNTATLDFRIFGRRHWGGYHFPRHFNLFDRRSMTLLAGRVGLEVESLTTTVSPVNWVYSIRNWLVDSHAPDWLVDQFSLKTPVPLALFTIIDGLFQIGGSGALLRLIARRP